MIVSARGHGTTRVQVRSAEADPVFGMAGLSQK